MSAKSFVAECVICGALTRTVIDAQLVKPKPVRYAVCDACGFIRKAPTTHPSPSAEKAVYDQHRNSFDSPGYVAMFERFIAKAVDPFITRGRGLDFGSGPGPVLHQLLERQGFSMRHYDPYYHPISDVFNDRYNLITATEVFEHLSDPKATFATLIERLMPGGILAVQTMFHPANDAAFLDWWYRRDATHIGFFTPTTFHHLAKHHPVRIAYHDTKNIVVIQKHETRSNA